MVGSETPKELVEKRRGYSMEVTIKFWHLAIGIIALVAIFLFVKFRKKVTGILLYLIILLILMSPLILIMLMIITERHHEDLGVSSEELRYITLYEKLTCQTVPYKTILERKTAEQNKIEQYKKGSQ